MAQNPMAGGPASEGIAAFKAGDVERALPLLRQAHVAEPGRFDLLMYLGLAMAKKEKWADSEKFFGMAADANGSSADAAYYQGIAIAKQGRLREAHGMFKVALGNNPSHPGALAAAEKTKDAASQVTTSGSSMAMPGGIAGIDMGGIDFDAMMGGKPAAPRAEDAMPSGVADALGQLKQDNRPAAAPAKKAGCIGGLVTLVVLLASIGACGALLLLSAVP